MYLVYIFKKNINHKDLLFFLCVYYCYLFEMQFEAICLVTSYNYTSRYTTRHQHSHTISITKRCNSILFKVSTKNGGCWIFLFFSVRIIFLHGFLEQVPKLFMVRLISETHNIIYYWPFACCCFIDDRYLWDTF